MSAEAEEEVMSQGAWLDLAAWLTERGPLPVELAVDLVLQACEAVAEAHSLGIVHREPGSWSECRPVV